MHININGHNVAVTPAIKSTIEDKFKKLERHLNNHATQAHIVLNIEKGRHQAEATVNIRGGQLFAESEHEDMYVAINQLVDKLDRQAVKFKEKMQDHGGTDEE